MSRNKESLVKISRPSVANVLPRERLFSLLDASRHIAWLSAPAGSGKTTLTASYLDSRKRPCLWYQLDAGDADIATFFYYLGLAAKKAAPRYRTALPLLTPEYLPGLQVFVLRYFEKLFSRLKPPFTLVFDNYQDVPNPEFHKIISSGLSALPEGIGVILISRADPPPEFARLRASEKMRLVGWDDIRFNPEESRFFWRDDKLPDPAQEKMYAKTEGWAAGLVLIGETLRASRQSAAQAPNNLNSVFDYFASELFDHIDAETRGLLLKTAYLPNVTPEIAEKITGISHAAQILSRLNRSNLFTQKQEQANAVYTYHPLFKEFLQSKAADIFSSAEINNIRHDAASLLEASGQIDAAVELFLESGSWNEVAEVILSHAPSFMAQGRSGTLERWLNALPQEIADHNPWLLFWRGMCRLFFNPPGSRSYFEKAFDLFTDANDIPGLFAASGSMVDSYILPWDDFRHLGKWLTTINGLLARCGGLPPGEAGNHLILSMFSALLYSNPVHTEISPWEKLLLSAMQKSADPNYKLQSGYTLGQYYSWKGEPGKAGDIVAILKPVADSPGSAALPRIACKIMEAAYWWTTAQGFDICENVVSDGLKLADESGIHILDAALLGQTIYSRLLGDDNAEVSGLLEEMKRTTNVAAPAQAAHYHFLASYAAICRNDIQGALHHAEAALGFAKHGEFVIPMTLSQMRLAYALFMSGASYKKIAPHLDEALKAGIGMESYDIQARCSLLRGLFLLVAGEEAQGLKALSAGMALNKKHGNFIYEGWRRSDIAMICARALEAGIEPEYAQSVIRKFKLTPPDASVVPSLANWPYPVRICTKGKFEIVIDGKPLEFSGKAPKKPLEMLKAIIAFGGKEVTEERLCDDLWPDAEGDLAHQSFATTLKRLRQLLVHRDAIKLQAGCVALDSRYCWVDSLQ